MNAPSLSRHVFKTSRLAEFSSKKELVNQTGHAVEDWPLVILKELLDNGLDACEEAGIAPAIEIVVSGPHKRRFDCPARPSISALPMPRNMAFGRAAGFF